MKNVYQLALIYAAEKYRFDLQKQRIILTIDKFANSKSIISGPNISYDLREASSDKNGELIDKKSGVPLTSIQMSSLRKKNSFIVNIFFTRTLNC